MGRTPPNLSPLPLFRRLWAILWPLEGIFRGHPILLTELLPAGGCFAPVVPPSVTHLPQSPCIYGRGIFVSPRVRERRGRGETIQKFYLSAVGDLGIEGLAGIRNAPEHNDREIQCSEAPSTTIEPKPNPTGIIPGALQPRKRASWPPSPGCNPLPTPPGLITSL